MRSTEATVAVLEVLSQSDESRWGLLIIKSSGKPAGSVYPILERLAMLGAILSATRASVIATRNGGRRAAVGGETTPPTSQLLPPRAGETAR
jgi:PadR family transcriptional regulator, regulatory protein PadR